MGGGQLEVCGSLEVKPGSSHKKLDEAAASALSSLPCVFPSEPVQASNSAFKNRYKNPVSAPSSEANVSPRSRSDRANIDRNVEEVA